MMSICIRHSSVVLPKALNCKSGRDAAAPRSAMSRLAVAGLALTAILIGSACWSHAAMAQIMSYAPAGLEAADPAARADESLAQDENAGLPERLRRAVVSYDTREPAGTVIIDTGNTYLYFILGGGRALRYGVGVGRQGFTWAGTENVSRKAEWPDWIPPAEMVARQPYLPRWVAGGPGNPLGARAMYLGHSSYRIHGTNDPSSIGKFVSSGCIRMTNEDVVDLFSRVQVGARVIVLPKRGGDVATAAPPRNSGQRVSVLVPTSASMASPHPARFGVAGLY